MTLHGTYKPALPGPVFFFLLFLALGCATAPPAGRPVLFPSDEQADGYSHKGLAWTYRGKDLLVIVRGYKPGPDAGGVEDDLYLKDYVLVEMGIENLSGKKVIYNPAMTSLRDDAMGYAKPLDFTDLYAMNSGEKGGLTGFGSRFYDLSITLMPGKRVERLLAFRPLEAK